MEVLYDLDDEARRFCDEPAIHMIRAGTPGNHPQFVSMIRKLIEERIRGAPRMPRGNILRTTTCALTTAARHRPARRPLPAGATD